MTIDKSAQQTISVVILTLNEKLHIERCINRIKPIAHQIFVIDCGSSDGTVELAKSLGAVVLYHPWKNYSSQFNWALENCQITGHWTMRLDADEYLDDVALRELPKAIQTASPNVTAFSLRLTTTFLEKRIRYGGMNSWLLRVWRTGFGRCESRWMDEHITISGGEVCRLNGKLIDHNLNSVTWWMDKHNRYASREAVDLLLTKAPPRTDINMEKEALKKRLFKTYIYAKLPLGVRPFLFWLYRITFKLGFMDGARGLLYHTLQGLCYRFLVDVKIYQVMQYARSKQCTIEDAIEKMLGINCRPDITI